MLKTHQIIELPGAIGSLENDSPIYIYSTINIFCSSVELGELVKSYTDVTEDSVEPVDFEDFEDTGESGEFTGEESKENIYEDVSQ